MVSANQLMPKNLFVGNTIPNCSEDNQNKDKDNKNKESNKDDESFSWRDAWRLPGGFLSQTVDDGSLPTPLCIVLLLRGIAQYCCIVVDGSFAPHLFVPSPLHPTMQSPPNLRFAPYHLCPTQHCKPHVCAAAERQYLLRPFLQYTAVF